MDVYGNRRCLIRSVRELPYSFIREACVLCLCLLTKALELDGRTKVARVYNKHAVAYRCVCERHSPAGALYGQELFPRLSECEGLHACMHHTRCMVLQTYSTARQNIAVANGLISVRGLKTVDSNSAASSLNTVYAIMVTTGLRHRFSGLAVRHFFILVNQRHLCLLTTWHVL